MLKFKKPYCIIRKDLNNDEIGIPIWDKYEDVIYIHGIKRGWRYRWLTEDDMQIKFGNKWYNVHSIDFDFINP